jgi:hypothetical protein
VDSLAGVARRRSPGLRAARSLLALGIALPACTTTPPASSGLAERPEYSDAADRQSVELTIYTSGFALVRERRRLHLHAGRVALEYADVAAGLEPATVQLVALDGDAALSVLEQNYRYDRLTPERLLEKYVGRRVSLVRADERAGQDQVRSAEVLAGPTGPVLRVGGAGGEIVTGLDERIVFPELPAGLAARPTLRWLLESALEEPRVEVSYLTRDLGWHADYVLRLASDGVHGDLQGWVTLDNQSGASFRGAQLALVAGDVQRGRPLPAPPPLPPGAAAGAGEAPALREQPLLEYHLYGLDRRVDVLDREQKQLGLLDAVSLPLERQLRLRGAEMSARRASPEPSLEHPRLRLRLENRAALGLGVPLPKGTLRVYQSDRGGTQQFVSETAIEHTPRDETLDVDLGSVFDVVAERRQVRWQSLGPCAAESEWRIELRNHESAAVTVEVREPLSGDFEVQNASLPLTSRDAHGFSFQVPVPARGANVLGYRLRARWCSDG